MNTMGHQRGRCWAVPDRREWDDAALNSWLCHSGICVTQNAWGLSDPEILQWNLKYTITMFQQLHTYYTYFSLSQTSKSNH